jgi:hypothetical protein
MGKEDHTKSTEDANQTHGVKPCRSIMPHSVAPINAAVNNKGKGAFRRPTVREEHKGRGIFVR